MSICTIKRLEFTNQQYALSAKGKQWAVGEVIDIAFLHGTKKEIDFLISIAEIWLKYANIKFNWRCELSKSDVRISFHPNLGSWSYIGTDAMFIDKNKATMNIGQQIPSTILHEFGHMLGLMHEHQNPDGGIQWNREKVIESLTGPPNNWDLGMIEHNVLNVPNSSATNGTKFDKDSIMLYSFPSEWTLNNKGTRQNATLSQTDIDYISKLYPKTSAQPVKKTPTLGFLSKIFKRK